MKRFLFLFIPLALLVMVVTIGIGVSLNRSAVASLKEHELGYLTTGAEQLLYHLETPIQQLQGFFREPDVKAALQQQDGHARPAMAQILLAMMYRNPVYDQVRWLSAAGQEVVRINNALSGPVIVAQTELQDKSDRKYYREAIRLHPGQIYVSPLELSTERNQVEVPHKPMLRMALRLPPAADRDQGLLVINVNARHFLSHLSQNIAPGHEQHPMFLNQAGYWLLSSRPEDTWGFMLGRDTTMSRRHPAEWAHMTAKPSGELATASGLWFWTTVDVARLNPAVIRSAEQWKLATHVTDEEIFHLQWQQWRDLLSMVLLTLGLLAVGLYYYLRLLIEKEQTAARLELVTARQEAEALLAASEERLRFALTASETGTWSLDVASGTVFRSEQHDRIFGYEEPVINWDHDLFLSHVLPDDRPQLAADIKNAVETMAAWTLECRIRRVDGAVRWIGIIGRSQVDGAGRVVRQDGIIRDVSARRQAEESLRKSETLLRLIMDYSSDVIFIKDLESRYLMVNPILEHLVGKSSSELLGTPPTQLFSDPAIGSHLMEHDSYVIQEGKAEVFEEILDTTLGRRIFETTKSPWYDEHGNIAGTVGISRDITEHKQIEQELFLAKQAAESANLAKSEFLAVMSHELRTPLATILGFTEILTEGLQGPLLPDQHKFIATIEESARHLLELINDILDLAKVEAGKVEVHYEECWLREVCEASLRFIKEPAHKKGIGTRQQFEAPDTLVTDVRLLKQVLINLLANAVKFTSAGGIIELAVAADLARKEIQFVVKDTGIGISPEDQARLFAPFIQVDSDLTRKNQGTGLGLALSSRLATVLGGSLTVKSTLGVGSRFILTLPLISGSRETQATDDPLAAPEPNASTGTAPLILIVDDIPDNLYITDTILNNAGYRTVTVTDGAVAVEAVTSYQPAAVLMDIQMPGIDGLQAIRQIRDLPPPLASTPIIAVTALAMPEDRERCLAAGADDYVTKPVKLKDLCRQLGRLLSRSFSEPR